MILRVIFKLNYSIILLYKGLFILLRGLGGRLQKFFKTGERVINLILILSENFIFFENNTPPSAKQRKKERKPHT